MVIAHLIGIVLGLMVVFWVLSIVWNIVVFIGSVAALAVMGVLTVICYALMPFAWLLDRWLERKGGSGFLPGGATTQTEFAGGPSRATQSRAGATRKGDIFVDLSQAEDTALTDAWPLIQHWGKGREIVINVQDDMELPSGGMKDVTPRLPAIAGREVTSRGHRFLAWLKCELRREAYRPA